MLRLLLLLLPLVMVSEGIDTESCRALGNPRAKCIINGMLEVISKHIAWDDWEAWYEVMKDFWTEDMVYDSNWTPNGDFSNNSGLQEFFDNEHIPFNLAFDNTTFATMIWIGGEDTASLMAYGKAKWIGDLGTVPGSQHVGLEVTIWDLDFYRIDITGELIAYNWCLIDFVDLMRQVGYQVLPKPSLREGFMLPPRAMDGIPAPVSRLVRPEDTVISQAVIELLIMEDFVTGDVPSSLWAEDMVWYGGAGFGMATSREEYETHILAPLRDGLSMRELHLDIVHCEGVYCGAHGYLAAVHTGEWLGEQATGLPLHLRLALHWRLDLTTGLARECWAMFDLPAAFNMIGVDLFARMDQEHRIE